MNFVWNMLESTKSIGEWVACDEQAGKRVSKSHIEMYIYKPHVHRIFSYMWIYIYSICTCLRQTKYRRGGSERFQIHYINWTSEWNRQNDTVVLTYTFGSVANFFLSIFLRCVLFLFLFLLLKIDSNTPKQRIISIENVREWDKSNGYHQYERVSFYLETLNWSERERQWQRQRDREKKIQHNTWFIGGS